MIRVVIAEDEAPARERLKRLLLAFPEIAVVGESVDGNAARAQIAALKPDAVFLDIEMPGADGMLVAGSLPQPAPSVVFCTAYDRYAVDAFGVNAVDYLLKPVTRQRLAETVEKLRRSVPHDEPLRRLLAQKNGRMQVVPVEQVLCFVSDGGLTRLRTNAEWLLVEETLNDLEAHVTGFFRASRSALVSLAAVREIHPLAGGTGDVVLSNGDKVAVSRRRLGELMVRVRRG